MEKRSEDSYFKKHWRGELELATSYWINNVFFSLLIVLITLVLGIVASKVTNLTFILILLLLFYIFIFFVYTPWAYIGLWRSSSNHIKKNNRFFWANVVRILIVIGIFRTIMAFTNNAYPQMVGYFKILTGTDDIPNYIVSLENNNTALKIMGGIKLGLTKEVASYIKKYPTIKTIHLESIGGVTSEARGVAKIVQENSLDTFVTGNCMSACTYIFVSGKERILSTHAQLGFHRPYFVGVDDKAIDTLIVKDKELFKKQGVDRAFIERIFSTPNSEALQVPITELKDVGIVTKIINVPNYFWKKSKKELALSLESIGIKKAMLEKDISSLINIVYKDMKASLPIKIDKITILNLITVKEKSLTYEYSILKNNSIKDLKEFQKNMESNVKIETCNNLFAVYILKHGVEILHIYRDKIDNSLLVNIKIKDCQTLSKGENE